MSTTTTSTASTEVDGKKLVSADRAFLLFVAHVGAHFDGLALLGRVVRTESPSDYVLPEGVELLELPHYEDLFQLRRLFRVFGGTVAGMWRAVGRVDCMWVLGPHPFALPLIGIAFARRKRVALGVRSDALEYYRARLPSRHWAPALLVVRFLDLAYRLLSRRLPTTVVGAGIRAHYGNRATVLEMTVSLVRNDDVAQTPPDRDWAGVIQLLAIGVSTARRTPSWHSTRWRSSSAASRAATASSGSGGARSRTQSSSARELALDGALELRGYVPFGPPLRALYDPSHVLVHTSLTEGVPQVLVEALAFGTPVVATDVGGVAGTLDQGPPGSSCRRATWTLS